MLSEEQRGDTIVLAAARDFERGSDAESQRSVVEQAYEIAMQVVALREQHNLTQAQLADRAGWIRAISAGSSVVPPVQLLAPSSASPRRWTPISGRWPGRPDGSISGSQGQDAGNRVEPAPWHDFARRSQHRLRSLPASLRCSLRV